MRAGPGAEFLPVVEIKKAFPSGLRRLFEMRLEVLERPERHEVPGLHIDGKYLEIRAAGFRDEIAPELLRLKPRRQKKPVVQDRVLDAGPGEVFDEIGLP